MELTEPVPRRPPATHPGPAAHSGLQLRRMESPDRAEQGTGRSGSLGPSAGGSDGCAGTAGTLLPLSPSGAALWAGPPPSWGPAGPAWNPGEDHSSRGSQRHLPELPATAPRKGAFPAACGRAHSLCQAGPPLYRCPRQHFSIPHTEQQDCRMAGDKRRHLSQNYWLWTSEEAAGTQSQDSRPAEPDSQVPRPNTCTSKQDAWTPKRNSWTLSWKLLQGPRSPGHSLRNFGHWLPATQPPAWVFCFPDSDCGWTTHTLPSFSHGAHPHSPASTPVS
ncbi:thrombopoietin isoform X6 [Erinaceus europaeus]|uniref:Thrombopoietin isoform X6 n=1 Tax=Erinaceus europaeus TaxID=9365 RepID=A0ABM3VUR5_ERIEU|nr:thrombopoietin isoform X6 [Erinaceus europaeus]